VAGRALRIFGFATRYENRLRQIALIPLIVDSSWLPDERVVVSRIVDRVDTIMACIRAHESGGDYRAHNPVSSAAGAYQFIAGTWIVLSRLANHPGWVSAGDAPAQVQDLVARWALTHGHARAWHGTGCATT